MTQDWFNEVAKSALCDPETLEATYDIAVALIRRDISGDFVEAGVYAGAHCAVMAKVIMNHMEGIGYIPRRVHLFDSFSGIPPHGPNDIEFRESGYRGGESACSRQQVEANMRAWGIPAELLVYHEGLFSETVPAFCEDKIGSARQMWTPVDQASIALLRLDGDLYESTKDCLPLLDHVSRGGYVIVDDFNLSGCRQAIMEKIIPAPIMWRIPCK
jgi:O-methyltransferase